jgi:4-hydroxybenzoate decarboxylase
MAAIQGVRDFLEVLEKNGQLLRIAEEVSLEPDIGAAGRAISQLGETMPALSFEKIKGYKNARIVTNIHGSCRYSGSTGATVDSTSTRPVSSAGIPMISKTMKSRMSACIGSR